MAKTYLLINEGATYVCAYVGIAFLLFVHIYIHMFTHRGKSMERLAMRHLHVYLLVGWLGFCCNVDIYATCPCCMFAICICK